MYDTCGERPKLGAVLVAQGALDNIGLDRGLTVQAKTGEQLGETLVGLGIICRPELDRAVAHQIGSELEEEMGFGSGLRAAIEQRHRYRRDFLVSFR
jgi:hypothetical protein